MCLESPALIDELHSIALRQNDAEDKRTTRIETKATALFNSAGLSLTVAFTFGGSTGDDYVLDGFVVEMTWRTLVPAA